MRTSIIFILASAFSLSATAQSCMPGMAMPGCPQPSTQEHGSPESPAYTIGADLPVPELLKDVSGRPPVSLAEFMSAADAHNPTVLEAKALARRSGAEAHQAGLYPNPTVGYQGDQIRGGSYGGGEQGGFIQQTIVLGGKLGLRREIYNQQQRSDQIGVQEQIMRVHADVERAFYDALTAQATVQLRQRLLGVALDAVETVHQLANVGQADAPDILQTEVESEQAKVDYVTAQRHYLESFHVLVAMTGQPDLSVSPLSGDIEKAPELDTDQVVASLVQNSPTVKHAQQEAEIARARLKDAKREAIPDLQLRAGEQYNGEQLAGTVPVKATGAQSFASAGIDIPLWNRNQGNVEAAKAEIERAQQEVVREQLSLHRQAAPLVQSYQSALFEAERYRTQLIPRASRAYTLYLQKYQQMAQAYPQVLVSQRTLFQLQIGYLQALHEVWSSAIALENYTLSGGLDAPMSGSPASTEMNRPGGMALPE